MDWLSAAVLCAATAGVYAWGAESLGFYYDDSGWMADFPKVGASQLFHAVVQFIPGRNLFPLWYYLFLNMAGDPARHLGALHVIQSVLDGMTAAGFFLLLRSLSVPGSPAMMAAGLFTFWPLHGETHFWLNDAPQNLASSLWVLLFAASSIALVRGEGRHRPWLWLLDFGAFLGALFTYDQPFFLLAGMAFARVAVVWTRRREDLRRFAAISAIHAGALAFYIWLKLRIPSGEAPTIRPDLWQGLKANALATFQLSFGRTWWLQTRPLIEQATGADWMLALAAAAAIMLVGLCHEASGKSDHPRVNSAPQAVLLVCMALAYVAAYLPIWLWYPAPRHHFLPSAPLFGAIAAASVVRPKRAAGGYCASR